MDYTIFDLEKWDNEIEEVAKDQRLDYYPQEFEIINYNDMLAYEVYVGMPTRYPHWSFGKAYEKLKTLYSYNLTGLPYEMVINSNPCIAYLMKDNTLLLQILTIAHVYGHNDFFKNNRLFSLGTDAKYTLEDFKNHADRIREYINDPSIGYLEVEKILNAAHALRYQTKRAAGIKRISYEEEKKRILEDYKNQGNYNNLIYKNENKPLPDLNKIPLKPEDDILYFIIKYGELTEWQKNIVEIVRDETEYFIPQIETKIMNEGWASYWHFTILNKLELKQGLHLEFIKRHNDVIAPLEGSINPYYLGFEIYKDVEMKYGREKLFEVRQMERDESFLRKYLSKELCERLNLFQYTIKENQLTVDEIADEEGWRMIRNTLSNNCGMGSIPNIRVIDMCKSNKTLTLQHLFDGRELKINYAIETLKYIVDLWGHKVILKTKLDKKDTEIVCDENKKISYTNRL
ncbi:SpoVR family protein [Clostridium sp. JN-9]|uniref:SpoVR family protein n=1 Tax=Clostridium sp. JN-9 TaxID=2507159 RepID=UPI000FFE1164|nr:SpoVR family protein [Clostridium sp. JN-9]QAT40088.1 SpoVR family protein [Clostridium sp. JN-9]